jgi:integrase/recombinase XerD
MAIKVVLRKKKNKNGTFPLALRITKNRVSSFIHLGHNLEEEFWDADKERVKSSHKNAKRLNNLIIQKLADNNDQLLELEAQNKDTSSASIKNKLRTNKSSSFVLQADAYIQGLVESGKFNRESADKPRVERFKEFIRDHEARTDISFPEITVSLLNKFKTYLKGTRTIKERTIVNHLVVIRTIFNQAIDAQIVDSKYYPFGRGKIVIKFPDSIKIGLTIEEVRQLENIELPPKLNNARNKWLFSFYFAGMRISDVLRLKWSDFQNDRLHYSMGKNDKGGSLKVPEKALAILEQYKRKDCKHNLVFPDLEPLEDMKDSYKVQKRISVAVRKLGVDLAEIASLMELSKPLTPHIARHTFGNISGDKIPIQMLQKLYRHTSITTTIGYQSNFIHKDADDALDAVIGSIEKIKRSPK